jgi:flagellar basal-body rod modification protein FlgD
MTTPIQNTAYQIGAQYTANSTASTTTNPNSASAQQDKFLLMLTTQLQNQDPMNPMDNAAITTQMAQLSTVTGIEQLNTTLQALTNSMQTTSAASLIGHGVMVPGSSIDLASSQAAAGVNLSGPADSVSVTIKDSSGNTVQTLQLGAQKNAGVVPFAWNGSTAAGTTAPDGSYTFTAQAVSSGATSAPTTLSYGTVNAVTPGATGATVNVGTLGAFALSAVQQVM